MRGRSQRREAPPRKELYGRGPNLTEFRYSDLAGGTRLPSNENIKPVFCSALISFPTPRSFEFTFDDFDGILLWKGEDGAAAATNGCAFVSSFRDTTLPPKALYSCPKL